jgi:predicted amidohydrolase YtcJ
VPVLALLLLLLAGTAAPATGADLLLEGATVYASPAGAGRPASILVRDGKVVFVGDPAEARSRAASARRVDLTGRFLFAGWADAHGHLEGLGEALESADLRGSASASEAARRMMAKVAALPAGAWVFGRGWDQNLWSERRFPDARELDAAVPDRPASAGRVDGHAMWVNTKALEAAGITRETSDPAGGRILRRADGSPSGVLVDNAMDLVSKVLPTPSPADRERRLLAAMRACASAGLTEVQDASGYGPESLEVLEKLDARGGLPIRVYATVSPEEKNLRASFARGVRIARDAKHLTVRAIKAYADGALGSRGAALLADYSDEPGKRGLLVTPPERLDEVAREARRNGWQLWVHAIGDRGNRIALDAYRKAAQAVPDAPAGGNRPRIEHAQVIALSDILRFGREGVIASIQPTHATSDMPWAEQRVGPDRIRGAYAWRKLKNAGARLAGGSDFPVESEKPVEGFYAAVTRQDPSGKPEGGWRAEERLTRAEALALFTTDAAWAAFEEDRRGRIVPGADADFTVFPEDPMTVPAAKIRTLPVVATIVGGEIVAGSIRVAVP